MHDSLSAPSCWDDYASIQQRRDRQPVDHRVWATEEQLDEFIDAVCGNRLPQKSELRSQWLDNLATNRAKKHRRRQSLLRNDYSFVCGRSQSSDPFEEVVRNESIARIRANTTAAEWRILWALACGDSYAAVGTRERLTVAALKSKVSRCRSRVQNCT